MTTARMCKPHQPHPPSTFYLAGPTAVGKTDFAISLAEQLNAEIVGCDAFQLYDGLPILTAKPEPEALARIPHHLVGSIPLTQEVNVAQYRNLALACIADIHEREKNALIVGGTGLYLRALTRGLADLPPADSELRARLETTELTQLQEQLFQLDPAAHGEIDLKNRRRVVRALEVCLLTGQPFSSFRETWTETPTNLRGILLDRDRTDLYQRIDLRVELMFKSGVLNEVATTGPIGATAAQTLGLKEIQAVLNGELSQEEAHQSIQQATRRYAKRQITWFKKEPWLLRYALTGKNAVADQVQEAARTLLSSAN